MMCVIKVTVCGGVSLQHITSGPGSNALTAILHRSGLYRWTVSPDTGDFTRLLQCYQLQSWLTSTSRVANTVVSERL